MSPNNVWSVLVSFATLDIAILLVKDGEQILAKTNCTVPA